MGDTRTPGLRWPYPIFRSLDGYRLPQLPRDVVAGVLVVIIAVPLSMGMAETAGVPPVVGLYCCVLPLIAYALFGSSPQLIIALDASTAAMVATSVRALAGGNPSSYLALASMLALLVGVILIVAGAARLGRIARLLTRPVLLGYQAALAVVVILSQLPRLLGLEITADGSLARAAQIVGRIGDLDVATTALGLVAVAIIVGVAARHRTVPGAVIALVVGVIAVRFGPDAMGSVAVVGHVPAGLPEIGLPAVTLTDLVALLPSALAIALLAAGDTVVSSQAFAARGGYVVNANRDLGGLGAANLASGISGGIPASASAARTAVVEMVGSRSQVASVVTALLMGSILLFMTDALRKLPYTALAAVVIVAVARLIEWRAIRELWRADRRGFAVVMVTAVVAVSLGLLQGIVAGVLTSAGTDVAGRIRRRRSSVEPVIAFPAGRPRTSATSALRTGGGARRSTAV